MEEIVTKQLTLKLIKPDGLVYAGLVHSVTLPGSLGQMTVLPEHEALISRLEPGIFYYRLVDDEGREIVDKFMIGEGFMEAVDDKVTVLTASAKRAVAAP